jgi:predicted nucleic acid-binding protein
MHTLIIDTNIFISALIKNNLTRYLIINSPFKLFIPEVEISEIKKYEKLIIKKSGQSYEKFYELMKELLKYVKIINNKNILHFRKEADKVMKKIDKKDVPFIAAALALDCPIWSDDKHFKKQKEVKIFSTKEVLEIHKNGNY